MSKESGGRKINTTVVIACLIAVCIIAVSTAIGLGYVKYSKAEQKKQSEENQISSETVTESAETSEFSLTEVISDTETSVTDAVTSAITTVKTTAKKIIETTTKVVVTNDNGATTQYAIADNGQTVPVIESAKSGQAATVGTTVATSTLPKDMYFSGLYSLGYDTIGLKEFIYNDDTADNCVQRKFGYNTLYDAGAGLIDFSIETTKIDFNYDNKSYRLQLWKGQYISGDIGTVGGEVGLYTRDINKSSLIEQYDCADKDDWLNMEMTILWDEDGSGVYKSQLTRKYALHWWETGYVDGQLRNENDTSELRILSRITFKTPEQAALVLDAMVKRGFKEVTTFNPTVKDTVKRYGSDIIFVWQDVR